MIPLFAATGGVAGRDPLSPKAWSGSASRLFGELAARGRLTEAIGVQAPWRALLWPALRSVHPDQTAWRARLSLQPDFRRALTATLESRLGGREGDLLQIGCYFDGPAARQWRGRVFAFHDGNLAQRLSSPWPPPKLGEKAIAASLAQEQELALRVDKVLTMSEWLRQSFIADYGVPPERVVAIGGGINLGQVPEISAEKDYTRPILAFVGVDFERKGGPELLQAFRAVRAVRRDAVLHVIGPRPQRLPDALAGGVVQHGYLSKAAMLAVFAEASLFVMPSRYEPFGLAPLEAMAWGLPAVVSGAWALAETVQPGVTGAHVPPGDAEVLADTMLHLLETPAKLKQMGLAAREDVAKRFTWKAVVDRLEQALA